MKIFKRVVSFLFLVPFLLFGFLTSVDAKEKPGSCLAAKVITLGDQEVAYYESKGKGPSVILLHGNSMSSYAFERQLCGSLGASMHLVAMDLPGHGRSSNAVDPASAYNLPGYADILVRFSEALGIEDGVFVGWSLGGHVLLEASGQLPSAKGFMIFGTPPLGIPPAIGDAFLATNPAAGLGFQSHLTNAELETYVASLFAPEETHIPDFFYKDVRRTDPASREQLLFSVGTLNYTDEINIVQSIAAPLAILHGESDQGISLSYIEGLNIQNLWGGKVHVIKGSGHTLQWESPHKFNRLLRAFVRDVSGCGRR